MNRKRQRARGQGTLFKRDPKGPWIARWFDCRGKRREASTRTTDKAAAERILAKRVADAALRRDGVIDPTQDRFLEEAQKPLVMHFADHDEYLRVHVNPKTGFPATPEHRAYRQSHLKAVADGLGWTKLEDLDRLGLERWLSDREADGMGARTRNTYALSWCAFGNWCVDTHRLVANPFTRLGRANERADRRRHRRALSANDLHRLIDATRRRPLAEYGRAPIKVEPAAGQTRKRANWTYEPVTPANIDDCEKAARARLKDKPELVAQLEALGRKRALTYKMLALTGLRFNELRSLTVGAADLEGTEPYVVLAAADEKARRGADIPLRADLAADLRQHLRERQTEAQRDALREGRPAPARLPAESPLVIVPGESLKVLDLDLVAAGLAHRVQGKNRKGAACWRIDKRDERGRTFDMHAFRTTFNSLLAAAGVPLTTRRILMRHAAEGITDEHYADAKLIDLRGALDRLPALPLDGGQAGAEREAANGTYGDDSDGFHPRLKPRQFKRESERNSAASRGDDGTADSMSDSRNALTCAELSDHARHAEPVCGKAGDGIRTHDVQLGKPRRLSSILL